MSRPIRWLAVCLLCVVAFVPVPASIASGTPPASALSETFTSPIPTPGLSWMFMAPMPTPRYNSAIAVSADNRIYVFGGDNYTCVPLDTVEEYLPARGTWRTLAPLPTGRWLLGAATGVNGLIYTIGGLGHAPCGADVLGTVEAFDPRSNTWVTRSAMPTPRFGLGVVAGRNGKIYALGGEDRSAVLRVVEEYDPLSDTWSRKGDMPAANRYFAAVWASNGKIYVIGGIGLTNRVWEFDPVADTWTERAPMPTARDVIGAAQARNGKIYVIGGLVNGSQINTVEAFDPAANLWSAETGTTVARSSLMVASVSSVVYAIGGWGTPPSGSGGPLGSVEAAKTPLR